jgi:hypothetical protein
MIASGLVQGATAFCAYVLLILILLRLFHKTEATFVVLSAGLVAYGLAIGIFVALGDTINFWVFSSSYWFLVLCFLMAFGAVYKSLSLRMLLTLLERPEHEHSVEAFRNEYIFGDSFAGRLQLIVNQGLAAKEGDRLSLTRRGKAWAYRVVKLQRTFGIMRSG